MVADFAPGTHSAPPTRIMLDLPARTRYLTIIRELVALAAVEHHYPPGEIAKTVMAVDEACANIIEHAYLPDDSRADPRINIRVDASRTQLAVTIGDQAQCSFSPAAKPKDDIDGYWASGAGHGLGLVILHHFMDRISHSYEPGRGNELRLIKYAGRHQAAV